MANTSAFGNFNFTPDSPGLPPTLSATLGGSPTDLTNASATLTDYNQIFGALLEYKWRDISFPYVHTTLELVQDQVIHKFLDRDSAHVEPMGRNPRRITARIPFLVGIRAAASETWQKPLYPLYPFTWKNFFTACADRTSGILQHPELGDITCKVERVITTWDAGVRTGVYVDATWIETDDTGTDLTQALKNSSPLAGLDAAAADLDTQIEELPADKFPNLPTFQFTFEDLVASVRGAIDQVTLMQKEVAGRLDNIIYQAQSLIDACDRATNMGAFTWPLYNAANLAIDSAWQLKSTLLNKQNVGISYFTVPKDATLGEVATMVNSEVVDVLMLNVGFAGLPFVPSGSIIRFYQ